MSEQNLATEFARARAWPIQRGLGVYRFKTLRQTIRNNLTGEKTIQNAIALLARIRKNEAQRAWVTQQERYSEYRRFALQDIESNGCESDSPYKSEQDLFHPGDNVQQVDFQVKKRGNKLTS